MKRETKKHLFEINPEYNLIYQNIMKQERVWRNTGQYHLAKVCEVRAARLLNGDISEAHKPVSTEGLYCPVRKDHLY
jgi:hypothetical protein|tara:strand:+ start:699 stop:929 length:231 start_codon:yes stop_codon:yes gene_type:complete